MARTHDYLKDGVTPRCQATVPDTPHRVEWSRCKRGAKAGGTLCGQHQHARDRLDNPDLYVICRSFKPARRNEDGSYRKTIYAKTFTSREAADEFLHLRWNMLNRCPSNGKVRGRFQSACVERLKDAVKKPGRRW